MPVEQFRASQPEHYFDFTPAAEPVGRKTKGERTRERLLTTAYTIFAERGFSGVSLRDVAARADITHAGLLHYFSGKSELLLTMMIERDRADVEAIRAYVERSAAAGGPSTTDEIMLRWLLRDIARNQSRLDYASLHVKISAEATDVEHPAHEYFRQRYEFLREAFTRSFRHEFARATPAVTDRDPTECAKQLIAMTDGLQIQWLLAPGTIDMVATLDAYIRSLGIDTSGWHEIEVPEP